MKLVFICFFFLAVLFSLGYVFYARATLVIGDKAPAFTLQNENGEFISSDKLFLSGSVLLYFYPKSAPWSRSCIKQSCGLRDNSALFAAQQITVVGINYESPEVHRSFKNKQNLPFMLLSDPKKSVARSYGATSRLPFFSLVPRRITFLISKGHIAGIINDVDPAQHTAQVLQAFEKQEK